MYTYVCIYMFAFLHTYARYMYIYASLCASPGAQQNWIDKGFLTTLFSGKKMRDSGNKENK